MFSFVRSSLALHSHGINFFREMTSNNNDLTNDTTTTNRHLVISSTMGIDVDKIQQLMRETHASGLNLSYEWRVKQLKALKRLLVENKDLLCKAVAFDLGKHYGEAVGGELVPVEREIKFVLKT